MILSQLLISSYLHYFFSVTDFINGTFPAHMLMLCLFPLQISVIASSYLLGRNPEYYPDPLEVKPERWIRNSNNKNVHSFAWLPFGYGARMCIGGQNTLTPFLATLYLPLAFTRFTTVI